MVCIGAVDDTGDIGKDKFHVRWLCYGIVHTYATVATVLAELVSDVFTTIGFVVRGVSGVVIAVMVLFEGLTCEFL